MLGCTLLLQSLLPSVPSFYSFHLYILSCFAFAASCWTLHIGFYSVESLRRVGSSRVKTSRLGSTVDILHTYVHVHVVRCRVGYIHTDTFSRNITTNSPPKRGELYCSYVHTRWLRGNLSLSACPPLLSIQVYSSLSTLSWFALPLQWLYSEYLYVLY